MREENLYSDWLIINRRNKNFYIFINNDNDINYLIIIDFNNFR